MSVVGGLFSDVFKSQGMAVPGAEGTPPAGTIDWSKAGGIPADLNWEAIKPFQVMPPMSWAATSKGATAPEEAKKQLDGIASTDTRSEYQKWLDSQTSTDGSRGRDNNGKGGLAGNGTNFTDKQWADIKTMNDQYGFLGNPVNQIGLTSLAQLAMPSGSGLLSKDNPFTAQQRSVDAIQSWRDSLALDAGVPISIDTSVPSGGLTPEQRDAMAASLSAAGYYTGSSGAPSAPSGPSTGAGVAEANGGFSFGDTSQGVWG